MQPKRGQLTFGSQIRVLSAHSNGQSLAEILQEDEVDPMIIQGILARRPRLERAHTGRVQRRHLPLRDKLHILHSLDTGVSKRQLSHDFGTSPRTIGRIHNAREKLLAMDSNRVNLSVHRTLYPKYLEIENRVVDFISFARAQRLLVTMHFLQERARMTAESLQLDCFRASNGWLENFLRRTSVQQSFKLHGKGGSLLPTRHAEQLTGICCSIRGVKCMQYE